MNLYLLPDGGCLGWGYTRRFSEGAADGLILCGDMEGVAQHSQSHISKLNSRRTVLPDSSSNHIWPTVLWIRCGWWQTGSQWDSWHSFTSATGCIMVVVQMRSAPGRESLKAACLRRSDWTHLTQLSTWLSDVVVLMFTGFFVCSCAESFFQRDPWGEFDRCIS